MAYGLKASSCHPLSNYFQLVQVRSSNQLAIENERKYYVPAVTPAETRLTNSLKTYFSTGVYQQVNK